MSNPVNLSDLTEDGFKMFIESFDHIISDCDGVIWMKTPLEGSSDFFNLMKKLGKTVHYASNNSLRPKVNYERLFNAAGIKDGYENLITPSMVIVEYLKSVNFDKDKYIFCVTCTETQLMLESHGYKCKNGPHLGPENYTEYIVFFQDDPEIGAVVFDSDIRINLAKLYKARTYLKRPEVLLLNGATDRYWPITNGLLCLGCGIFSDLVAEETNREPIVLAKPGKMYGECALSKFGVTDPSRVLFIGDMIDQDVGLGKVCGFKTLLVLTNLSEEVALSNNVTPDFYAPSLGHIVPLINKYYPVSNGSIDN